MVWTPETLARRLHEAYGRVTPKFYGYTGNAPTWESIPEKSREHLIAVCADVLGVEIDIKPVEGEAVPKSEEFNEAREIAVETERAENGLSDWEADLQRQINSVTARDVRRAFTEEREPFRK